MTLKTAAYTLYICISDKTNMPCLSTWLNTGVIRPMKVTGKLLCSVVMALTSTLCAALHC